MKKCVQPVKSAPALGRCLAFGLLSAIAVCVCSTGTGKDLSPFSQLLIAASAAEAPQVPTIEAPSAPPSPPIDDPWSRVKDPAAGPAVAIGNYAGGCIQGAARLESHFPEYQIMRPTRRRFFGHPNLLAFLKNFAKKLHDENRKTILFGDMAQPRGGPLLSGHASHQTGLDVDIWLWEPPVGRKMSLAERNSFSAPQMVRQDFGPLTSHWRDEYIESIHVAAEDPAVQRILLNPVVKKEVCRLHKGEPWVHKLRPWWAHTDHFHVRLYCPDNDPQCARQDEAPPGDGCDQTLDDWLTPEMREKSKEMREHPSPPTMPVLPDACQAILQETPADATAKK